MLLASAVLLRHALFCAALAILSAVVVGGMLRAGSVVIDRPDPRKAHLRPTPKGGGVGVVAAFLAGIVVLYLGADFSRLAEPYFRGVILGSVGIAAVSFADDLRDWPFTVKLAAQVAAALLVVGSGLWVEAVNLPGLGPASLGWLGVPATILWILVLTNAVNFMDGLDGLVAGACLIACLFLALVALGQGGWFAYFAALLLASGLAGFLPWNYPRARIFMGDVGSQFCGFVLAVLGVAAGRFSGVQMSALLVPMLLAGLLWDVLLTLARRLLAGERLTQPHRGHLYQVAHRSGMPAPLIAAVHWGFAAWGGACCLLFVAAPSAWKPVVVLLVLPPQLAWTAYVVRLSRRAELGRW